MGRLAQRLIARRAQLSALQPKIEEIQAKPVVVERITKRTFREFLHALHPEYGGVLPRAHETLVDAIQAWRDSEEAYNLMFLLPPGHGKSYIAKAAIAWIYSENPDEKAALASYGQDLADEHCGDLQTIMLSERYERLAPLTRLNKRRVVSDTGKGAKRTKNSFEVVGRKGKFRAVGFGGPLTGQRVNVGVIDDPIKNAEEAASPTLRQKQWIWYTRVLLTRHSPGVKQKLLMILTRWHLDDLAGRVLKQQPDKWRVIRLPAIKDGPPTDLDPREPGEALWPDMFPLEALQEQKRLDPYGWEALYQGRPVPEGGSVFKESSIQRWHHLPDVEGEWVQSWDLRAGGKGLQSSYAVGQLWFKPHGTAQAYLVSQVRGRWDTDESLDVMRRINIPADKIAWPLSAAGASVQHLQPLWSRARAKLVEAKADGIAALSQLRREIAGLTEVQPKGDKLARARAVQIYVNAGNVLIPAMDVGAAQEWLHVLEGELFTFPVSENDDQVDALTQALDYLFAATDLKGEGKTEEERAQEMALLFS